MTDIDALTTVVTDAVAGSMGGLVDAVVATRPAAATRQLLGVVTGTGPLTVALSGESGSVELPVLGGYAPTVGDVVVVHERVPGDLYVAGRVGDPTGWVSEAPTFTASGTNPALGTGGQLREGRYLRTADGLIMLRFTIRFGDAGASAGSGNYFIAPPVPPSSALNASAVDNVLGTVWGFDQSANQWMPFRWQSDGSMRSASGIVHAGSPWAWGAADRLQGSVIYEPA